MAPPYPRDPADDAAAAGVVDYRLAAEEAEAEEEAELPPLRTESDEELAVPDDWRLMDEDEDVGVDEDEEDEEEAFDDDDEEMAFDDDDDEEMSGDHQVFAQSFEFSEFFAKGAAREDNTVEGLANAQSIFSRRWSFPDGLDVTVKKIDCLGLADDILDLMLKLVGDHGWTVNNVDRLKQAVQLDKGLQQLQRGLRRLRISIKSWENFEGANSLGDLMAEIEGCCSLQPASTRGAVLFITTSVATLLAACATDSPPYEELMVTVENLWGLTRIAREEAVIYTDP